MLKEMQRNETLELVLAVFVFALWATLLSVPWVLWRRVGFVPAIASGMVIPFAWIVVFGGTCRSAGLGGSLLALAQFFSGVLWLVIVAIAGVIRLFNGWMG